MKTIKLYFLSYYIRYFSSSFPTNLLVITYLQWTFFLIACATPLFAVLRALILVNKTAAQALPEACTELMTSLPPSTEYDGMLFRLNHIIVNRPCELLVLGYKASPGDAVKLLIAIIGFQLASFTGLSWIVGR